MDMNDEVLVNKSPDGEIGDNDNSKPIQPVSKYKKWIRLSNSAKQRFIGWAKEGQKAYKGYSDQGDGSDKSTVLVANEMKVGKVFKYEVNFIRQPIEQQITRTYARNPKFIAKPTQPIWVDADPMQVQDPVTGAMMLQPQIGTDGLPMQNDISEQVCDVVEALMEVVFTEANFKAEAKSCTREAHHSPGSVMQLGYQFDEDGQRDEIYFRRRQFKNVIIDPQAEIYDGVVRRCRYMGVKWQLSKEEATALGMDWNSISSKENLSLGSEDAEQQANVYHIWDKESGVVVWVPEHGNDFAVDPKPWPWKLKGFPFQILKFTEDTDQQFSKPPVLEALPIQEELNAQREEITANTTNKRTFTIYDPTVIDEEKMTAISRRGKGANIPIEGLLGMPQDPVRRIGEGGLDTEFYNHYQRNRSELTEVLGTSQNEALQSTKSTASEAQIIDKNAGASSSGKIDIQTDFLDACAETAIEIMKQTYTTERVTQVTGRDNAKYWVKWVGSELLKNISISVETGSTEKEDSSMNRQISLNMLETMKGVPGIDVAKLAVDVLRDHGRKNAETYRIDMIPPQPTVDGMNGQAVGPNPNEVPTGVGPTTGMNPADSLAGQMNPMV